MMQAPAGERRERKGSRGIEVRIKRRAGWREGDVGQEGELSSTERKANGQSHNVTH